MADDHLRHPRGHRGDPGRLVRVGTQAALRSQGLRQHPAGTRRIPRPHRQHAHSDAGGLHAREAVRVPAVVMFRNNRCRAYLRVGSAKGVFYIKKTALMCRLQGISDTVDRVSGRGRGVEVAAPPTQALDELSGQVGWGGFVILIFPL